MDHHFPPANPADAQYYNYPTPQPETLMGVEQLVALVERIGLPAVIIGAAFWFIRYQSEMARKEREEFWKKDEEHDAKLLEMVEKSSDAILQIKLSIEQNTAAMREMAAAWKR